MLQLRNLFKISPRYLTLLILSIYWPLILKLRCLLMLDWDFGLNNIISVLLAFNDIIFALSQMFNSFKSWLMCLFIFFSGLSDSSRFVSSAKWCKSVYLITLLRSLMQIRNSKTSRADPIIDICIFWRGTTYRCVLLPSP